MDTQKVCTYQSHHDHRQPTSVLSCSRLSCLSSSEHANPGRQTEPNVSLSLVAARLSTINVQATVAADANTPHVAVTSSHDDADSGGTQLLTVPRLHFLAVDNMKQTASVDVLASEEDDHCLS